MFDDDFIENLSDNPLEGLKEICNLFLDKNDTYAKYSTTDYYDKYLEIFALLSSFLEAHQLGYDLPKLTNDRNNNVNNITKSFISIRDDVDQRISSSTLEILKSKYQAKIKNAFAYEFSDGDLNRIQTLIDELRNLITKFVAFDNSHRARLLKRLERLQFELHKRVSDLDRFWGLIGDAGVVIGKFGNDAKPFVDRIREISDIIWRTQSRVEELPSDTPTPLLSCEKDEDT